MQAAHPSLRTTLFTMVCPHTPDRFRLRPKLLTGVYPQAGGHPIIPVLSCVAVALTLSLPLMAGERTERMPSAIGSESFNLALLRVAPLARDDRRRTNILCKRRGAYISVGGSYGW